MRCLQPINKRFHGFSLSNRWYSNFVVYHNKNFDLSKDSVLTVSNMLNFMAVNQYFVHILLLVTDNCS